MTFGLARRSEFSGNHCDNLQVFLAAFVDLKRFSFDWTTPGFRPVVSERTAAFPSCFQFNMSYDQAGRLQRFSNATEF